MRKTLWIAFGLMAPASLAALTLVAEERQNKMRAKLASPDVAVRRAAMVEFAQAEHRHIDEVLPIALPALKDSDAEVRHYAVVALMATGSIDVENATRLSRAAPALIERLDDSEPVVREAAATALTLIMPAPPRAAARRLVELVQDPNPGVQKAALGTLARLGPVTPQVAPAVRELLHAVEPSLRAEAAKVLAELGASDSDNVWALVNALDDPDNFVRQNVVRALGKMGRAASGAIPRLQEIVNKSEEDPTVREYARYALRSIEGKVER